MTEAVKYDAAKARMDLIPADALLKAGEVFAYGADKYSDRNWERGFNYGRLYAATQRHLHQFWAGEDLDPESGHHHLAHALCCVLMLYATVIRFPDRDDRRLIEC